MARQTASPTLDPALIRAQFPSLRDGYAYLDGAAGTQVPEAVIEAVSAAYRSGLSNLGGAFPASHRSEEVLLQCRGAVADLVGGVAEGVVLGPNMTTLTYRIAPALAKTWGEGDEVLVSELDHDANVRPWVQVATAVGARVRFARIDPDSGELPVEQYRELVGERTRLVAVTAASNVLGTRPDVAAITAIAHRAGALTYVDGVHATPHGPIDVAALGADFYVTSAYKWCGPHIGALIADPGLLETIYPDKLIPSPDEIPDRFQLGTPPFADYAGVTAAVEMLASLLEEGGGDRRARLQASMAALEAYEQDLFGELIDELSKMEHVKLVGSPARRAPTAYFNLRGLSPDEVAVEMARRRINVWSGDNYAFEVTRALGIREGGCAVRAGLVHYNDRGDVERLLGALAELAD